MGRRHKNSITSTLRRLIVAFAFVLVIPLACAQTVVITGTVNDPHNNPYQGGSGRAALVSGNGSGQQQWLINGTNPVGSPVVISALDSFGHFSITLTNTSLISPGQAQPQWQFSFNSAPPPGCSPQVSFTMPPLSLTANQDISAQIKAAAALLPASCSPSGGYAPGGTTGMAQSVTSTQSFAGEPNTLYADQFAGSDPCVQIGAAIAALPSSGGTIDARSFTGNPSCASTLTIGKTVNLELSHGNWTMNGSPGVNVTAPNVVIDCSAATLYQPSGGTFLISGAAAPLISNTVGTIHAADGPVLNNCQLNGNSTGTFGVFFPTPYQTVLNNVLVENFTSAGVLNLAGQALITNTKSSANGGDGFVLGYDSQVGSKTQAISAGADGFHIVTGGDVLTGVTAYQSGLHSIHIDADAVEGSDWSSGRAYVEPKVICPTSNNAGSFCFYTQVVGTSGVSRPSFCQTIGCNTPDGSVTWINVGTGNAYGGAAGSQFQSDCNFNKITDADLADANFSGTSGTWAHIAIDGNNSSSVLLTTITAPHLHQNATSPLDYPAAGLMVNYAYGLSVTGLQWWGGAWSTGSNIADKGGVILNNTAYGINLNDINCTNPYSNCLKITSSQDVQVGQLISQNGGVSGSPTAGNYAIAVDSSSNGIVINNIIATDSRMTPFQRGVSYAGSATNHLYVKNATYANLAANDAGTFNEDSLAGTQYYNQPTGVGWQWDVNGSQVNALSSTGMSVASALSVGTTLGVTGAATLSSTLGVSGAATFSKQVGVADAGTCTLSSGACSAQPLSTTYTNAPVCVCSWNHTGTFTGLLSCPSSTTTVTPTDSVSGDTGHINWACFCSPSGC